MFGVPRRALLSHAFWLRARLRRARGARFARYLGFALIGLFGGGAIALRSIDGRTAAIEGYVVLAARVAALVSGSLVALSAANQRGFIDRREGVELLSAMRGVRGFALDAARGIGTALEIARVVALPPVAVGALTVALAGSGASAIERTGVVAAVLLFALMVGLVLGAVTTALDRLRPAGARGWLLAVLILPWALFETVGVRGLSIPGFLAGVLDVSLRVFGMGRLA